MTNYEGISNSYIFFPSFFLALIGWGGWTVWSECDENGEQHRRRKCETPGPSTCQGHDFETRLCVGVSNGKSGNQNNYK